MQPPSDANPARLPRGRPRIWGWMLFLALLATTLVLVRLTFDFGRLHIGFGLGVGAFVLGVVLLIGKNARELASGVRPADDLGRGLRITFALAVPLAFLASTLDCMGLSFSGCTPRCTLIMRVLGPTLALLVACGALLDRPGLLALALLATPAALVPNCVCRNPANGWWMDLLGESPACFVGSAAITLLAASTLLTRRRAPLAALLCAGAVGTMFAFWIGHHYFHVPW